MSLPYPVPRFQVSTHTFNFCVLQHTCEVQRMTCGRKFSSYTMLVLRIELRFVGKGFTYVSVLTGPIFLMMMLRM